MSSKINYQEVQVNRLGLPEITGRATGSQSVTPDVGVTVYDKTTKAVYVGDGTDFIGCWGATVLPVNVTIGPESASGNAFGLSIDPPTQVLTAHDATTTTPGLINFGAQTLAGVKTFNNGVVVQSPIATVGVTNLLNKFCQYTLTGNWTTAITLARSLQLMRIGDTLIIMIPESVQAGSPSGYAVFDTTLPPEFVPQATVGGSIPIWSDGNTGVGYFNLSPLGQLVVGIRQGVLSNPPGLVPMLGFAASGAGNTGISDCCIVCRLTGTTP